MNIKVLASFVSLAVVAFLPHTSFASKAAPLKQAVEGARKTATGVRTTGQVGRVAAPTANLGTATGAAGSVVAGAQAGAAAQAGTNCNMSALNDRQRQTSSAYYSAFGGNGGQAAACNAKIFENLEAAKNAVLIQKAALAKEKDIKAGKVDGYAELVEEETGLKRGTLQQLCAQNCGTVPAQACQGLAI